MIKAAIATDTTAMLLNDDCGCAYAAAAADAAAEDNDDDDSYYWRWFVIHVAGIIFSLPTGAMNASFAVDARLEASCQSRQPKASRADPSTLNVGALIIRKRFWGVPDDIYTLPPNLILIIQAPTVPTYRFQMSGLLCARTHSSVLIFGTHPDHATCQQSYSISST